MLVTMLKVWMLKFLPCVFCDLTCSMKQSRVRMHPKPEPKTEEKKSETELTASVMTEDLNRQIVK